MAKHRVRISWGGLNTGVFTVGRSKVAPLTTSVGYDTIGYPYSPGYQGVYDDVSGPGLYGCLGFSIIRGSDDAYEGLLTGRATLTLHDKGDGRYNPKNQGSPLWNTTAGKSLVRPMRPCVIEGQAGDGSWEGLFYGWLSDGQDNPDIDAQQATFSFRDLTLWLDRAKPVIAATGPTTVGAAIGLLLDSVGWTDPARRSLQAGSALASFSANGSKAALTILKELLQIDLGTFFHGRNNIAYYFDRYELARRTSVGSFEVAKSVVPGISLATVRNRSTVTKEGSAPQTVEDADSVLEFGENSWEDVTSPFIQDDAYALGLSQERVRRGKEPSDPTWTFELSESLRRVLKPTAASLLTVSGNEITDASRALKVQGDGRAVTNLVPNGGFETNTTGWAGFNGGAISRITGRSKYGSASLQVVAAIDGDGCRYTALDLAPGTTYVFSMWVYAEVGESLLTSVESPSGTFLGYVHNVTGSGGWQRVSGTFVAGTGGSASFYPNSSSGAQTFYIDGAQLEEGTVATPYIETDGAVVTVGVDSSYGVWEPTTNLIPNGGFEAGITGAGNNSNAVVSQDSAARFGTKGLLVAQAAAGNYSAFLSDNLPVAPSTTYTVSLWIKAKAGADLVAISIGLHNGAVYTLFDATPYTALTSGWVRRTHTFTTAADTATIRIFVATSGTVGTGNAFYLDGVQLEQQPIATPYVETSGATATRAAGRVQAPASLLNATQGWVVARARMGWGTSPSPFSYASVFSWLDAADDGIHLFNQAGGVGWRLQRYNAGVFGEVSLADTLAHGDLVTVIAAWTSTALKISVDGSEFVSVANTTIPTISAALFDIAGPGASGSAVRFNSDILWFACGTGILTDADVAVLHQAAIADEAPGEQLSEASVPTFVWPAKDSSGILPVRYLDALFRTELLDRVTVKDTYSPGEHHVRKIVHTAKDTDLHQTGWTLLPRAGNQPFVVGKSKVAPAVNTAGYDRIAF